MVKIYYVDMEVTAIYPPRAGKVWPRQTVGAVVTGLMLPELMLQRVVLVMA